MLPRLICPQSTEVPSYTWSYEVEQRTADGRYPLRLEVEQSGVSPGFRMPVPVRLELGGGEEGQVVVLVDEARESFEIALPASPKKVVFKPGHAVLARVVSR